MHPVEALVRNPVKVAVGALLLLLFGIVGLLHMPVQLAPEISIPAVHIETRWRGASPLEIEREIVQKQEEQLQSVQGVTKLSSSCRNSQGLVTLEFQVGTDLQEALVQVNTRLAQVPEYPRDASEPLVTVSDASQETLAWYMLTARLPTTAELQGIQQSHPEFAARLQPARDAARRNQGFGALLLRRLANRSDKLRGWLPVDFASTPPSSAEIQGWLAHHPEFAADLAGMQRASADARAKQLRETLDKYDRLRHFVGELLPEDLDLPKYLHIAEDHIETRFERIPGVSKSETWGGRKMELQVVVDPYKLAARGLTILDVRTALQRNNMDASAGDFQDGKRRWVVRTVGQYRSIEEVQEQLVGSRGGQPVYIRDVVVKDGVRIGYQQPRRAVRRYGAAALAIRATRQPGANVLEVVEQLDAAVAELNRGVLAREGLQLTPLYNRTGYIRAAVGLVQQSLVGGGALAVIVLLLFLRSGRSTLIISAAIPLSIVGTFLSLSLLGRSLNVVSLAGLAFAVGMLVDNSVVVLENIYRHWQHRVPAGEAAVRGVREVWGAIVASTLTTLAVFLPILFIQEEVGQLFRDIALAISSAVAISLVVSVTVVPAAAAWLLSRGTRRSPSGGGGRLKRIDTMASDFVHAVVRLNRWVLQKNARQLLVVCGLVAVSLGLIYGLWPQANYLPTGNLNFVGASIQAPPGYDLSELMAIGERVESELSVYWNHDPHGKNSRRLDYPGIADWFFTVHSQSIGMGFISAEPSRARELIPLIRRLEGRIPGTTVSASQNSLFSVALRRSDSIDVEVMGPRLERLMQIAETVAERVREQLYTERRTLSGRRRVTAQVSIGANVDAANPEVHIVPKRLQAAELELDTVQLADMMDAVVDGAYATDYYLGGKRLDLSVVVDPKLVRRTQDLAVLPVATAAGTVVPLQTLADIRLGTGPQQIHRRERERAVTIRVSPPPEMALEQAVERIRTEVFAPLIASGQLQDQPHGARYDLKLSGSAGKLQETWQTLRWNVLLALLITYLLMAALFESWVYPLIIMLSVPLAGVGGVLGLYFLNAYQFGLAFLLGHQPPPPQTLDVLNMLGFVILIGTSINSAILIVHQSLNHMRFDHMRPRDALLQSVRNRIRPICMTTTTTCCGLAPLVFVPGAGSELYSALGSIVLGGLLMSALLTLLLVPALFHLALEARPSRGSFPQQHQADRSPQAPSENSDPNSIPSLRQP